MNTHLNIFRTYAKENRRYQLENDLTRALAICMQEDSLFFHEILKSILDPKYVNEFFNDLSSLNQIEINIQKNSSEINGFEKIFAVSLSEYVMLPEHFWNQNYETLYDPICDIVININGIVIIIEAKRDNVDCTAQLYNQVFNILKKNELTEELKEIVVPVNLNWQKLMEIAVKAYSFEKATNAPNRFLNDFIDLVKNHNFRWLPEPSIFSVSPDNTDAIYRRIESVINELNKKEEFNKLDYNNRLGLSLKQPWAQEILFSISENGDLIVAVYPGNTKSQGAYIFNQDSKPKDFISVGNKQYQVSIAYHVKFTSFQRYFTGLWFTEKDLIEELYTKDNFWKYCGRKKRGKDWDEISQLFDKTLNANFNWKKDCEWEAKIIKSKRSQFDMSFGYELSTVIPFQELRETDQNKSDLSGLTVLIESIYNEFRTIYI
ncbi:hypothetical protein [Sabulibacter ruber]|uniref:hypothetical protein n=1 Tax=Sabulibacter ruber TaxID=2811901 RepID=UPI001A9761FB|nr:hypothetical protein [Sabulibacter ruber]